MSFLDSFLGRRVELRVQFEHLVLATHRELDDQLLGVGADEDVRRGALPPGVLVPVLLLGQAVRHVHTPQQAGGRVVGRELDN